MIYCCKISSDSEICRRALSVCSDARREKVQRLKGAGAQSLSIAAGLLLRYCLLKEGADDSEIKYTSNGKPYLENNDIFFSLSHSGEYAACVTAHKPAGIDIQKIVDIKESVIARFCTEREQQYLKDSSAPKTDVIRLWALKESYLKASGCGTAEAFSAEFELCKNGTVCGPKGYEFELFDDISGYVTAVCYAV